MTQTRQFNIPLAQVDEKTTRLINEHVENGLAYLGKEQADRAVQSFKQALEPAPENSSIRDIITHNLLTGYRLRIRQILEAGDATAVNRFLPFVGSLTLTSELAADPDFRYRFAETFKNIGMDFYEARQHEAALFFIRKAIAVEPCPSFYVDLTNALAWLKTPAELRDYTTAYTERDIGHHIFITCAPKSGSTFLKNVLVAVTGFRDLFPVYAALQNEHELDLPQFVKFGTVDTVTQQHARASEANIQMMQAFGVRPVILVRNIFDTAASLLDFYSKGFAFSTYFDKAEFLAFDRDKQIDLLIEFAIPWYFQFVASWQRAERENRLEVEWLTYEEMIADKPAAVAKVLEFYGMAAPADAIREKIRAIEADGEKNRFNKGVAGRGKTLLSEQQKSKIADLAAFFPSGDFRLLGI
jgi:tetratricopeptide (TPR) repeat protein